MGIEINMPLTDARLLVPELNIARDNATTATKALAKLANLLTRFTPWVAIHGINDLYLDVSGCSDLFGGELSLLNYLYKELY